MVTGALPLARSKVRSKLLKFAQGGGKKLTSHCKVLPISRKLNTRDSLRGTEEPNLAIAARVVENRDRACGISNLLSNGIRRNSGIVGTSAANDLLESYLGVVGGG